MVIKVGNRFFKIKGRDNGFPHPEDKGLLRCERVEWDRKAGRWTFPDDDDYLITDDRRVAAREIGWELRRET